ncbi:hypothetical protein SEA_ELINAL_36 [Gordonia phage Elinal]|nr:hypothetical protein SEA_ELINAL_36 [Gordonia phage Elinal]
MSCCVSVALRPGKQILAHLGVDVVDSSCSTRNPHRRSTSCRTPSQAPSPSTLLT